MSNAEVYMQAWVYFAMANWLVYICAPRTGLSADRLVESTLWGPFIGWMGTVSWLHENHELSRKLPKAQVVE